MFGRARSKAELEQMRRDYFANLEVEIDNANKLEMRKRKPDEAPPVPPQYRTEAEIRADVMGIRNDLIQTLIKEFDLGYTSAAEIANDLSADDQTILLAMFPSFKLEFGKEVSKTRIKTLRPDFVKAKIKAFVDKQSKSFGTTYGEFGTAKTLDDLMKIIPSEQQIDDLIRKSDYLFDENVISKRTHAIINNFLLMYKSIIPTEQQLKEMQSKLNTTAQAALASELSALLKRKDLNLPSRDDMTKLISDLDELAMQDDLSGAGEIFLSNLGGASKENMMAFKGAWELAFKTLGGKLLPEGVLKEELQVLGEMMRPVERAYTEYTYGSEEQQDFGEEPASLKKYNQIKTEQEQEPLYEKVLSDLVLRTPFSVHQKIANKLQSMAKESGQLANLVNEATSSVIRTTGTDIRDLINNITVDEAKQLIEMIAEEYDKLLKERGVDDSEIAPSELKDEMVQEEQMQKATESKDVLEAVAQDTSQSMANAMEEVVQQEQEEVGFKAIFPQTTIDEARKTVNRMAEKFRDYLRKKKNMKDAIETKMRRIADEARLNYNRIFEDNYPGFNPQTSNMPIELRTYLQEMIDDIERRGYQYNFEKQEFVKTAKWNINKSGQEQPTIEGFGTKSKSKPKTSKLDSLNYSNALKETEKGVQKLAAMKNPTMKDALKITRISVKKLIGKGIEAEQQPRYKQFGKYVIHHPHLVNNVFNVKYPSLGAIPAIKPKTISDDYKEFVMDVLESGKVNDRAFSRLSEDEQNHFHKVCKGAGLLETFRLKNIGSDKEKEDLDRFNLLRGSYMAGNDSESVIRELRALISKFVQENRITKNEGLQLLMEIQ